LLVTNPNKLSPGVLEELQRVLGSPGGAKTIFIAGGVQALPQNIAKELTAAGFTNQIRFAGETRDDTARLIALEVAARNVAPLQEIAVSENQAFADTLGVGPVASQQDANGDVMPILLTTRAQPTLSPTFVQFLQSQPQLTLVHVVGGSMAVDPAALSAMQAMLPGATINVYAGDNRYGSDAAINRVAFSGARVPNTIVVASGEASALPGAITTSSAGGSGFFAALLAGTIAVDEQAPVVLTRQAALPQEIVEYLTPLATNVTKVIIVGDTNVVSAEVEQQLRTLVL
jgi:putative cell wall-binding protein